MNNMEKENRDWLKIIAIAILIAVTVAGSILQYKKAINRKIKVLRAKSAIMQINSQIQSLKQD